MTDTLPVGQKQRVTTEIEYIVWLLSFCLPINQLTLFDKTSISSALVYPAKELLVLHGFWKGLTECSFCFGPLRMRLALIAVWPLFALMALVGFSEAADKHNEWNSKANRPAQFEGCFFNEKCQFCLPTQILLESEISHLSRAVLSGWWL